MAAGEGRAGERHVHMHSKTRSPPPTALSFHKQRRDFLLLTLCLKATACPFHATQSSLAEDSITANGASQLQASSAEHLNMVSELHSSLSLALQYTLLCQMPTCLLWKLFIITTIIFKK